MEFNLPRVNPGDTIGAHHINDPNEAIEQLKLEVGASSGLGYSQSDAGQSLWVVTNDQRIWAKITGFSSSKYSWTEQIPAVGGGWIDGLLTGTVTNNYAIEVNGNAGIANGTIVLLTMSEIIQGWTFQYGACA